MTLGQVMEANKIENLLKNHSAVKIKTELYEQEGDETPVSSTTVTAASIMRKAMQIRCIPAHCVP